MGVADPAAVCGTEQQQQRNVAHSISRLAIIVVVVVVVVSSTAGPEQLGKNKNIASVG